MQPNRSCRRSSSVLAGACAVPAVWPLTAGVSRSASDPLFDASCCADRRGRLDEARQLLHASLPRVPNSKSVLARQFEVDRRRRDTPADANALRAYCRVWFTSPKGPNPLQL